jgi:hypothetical protein
VFIAVRNHPSSSSTLKVSRTGNTKKIRLCERQSPTNNWVLQYSKIGQRALQNTVQTIPVFWVADLLHGFCSTWHLIMFASYKLVFRHKTSGWGGRKERKGILWKCGHISDIWKRQK